MPIPGQRWAVIGGGFLGMRLAQGLRRHGGDVTLYEAAPHLGGLASAWQIGDVVWDRHYHVTLLSDTYLHELLRELELEGDLTWETTRTGFYVDGKLHSLSSTWEFLKFPPLGFFDRLRLGATIFYASKIKNWRRLEKIPVTDWLRRLSGRRTFERIWLPLLRAKLGENYRKTSAAFIWAIIARTYAARRSGAKRECFGYVRGGYARILERFAVQLERDGVELRLGEPVRQITSSEGCPLVETMTGNRQRYDQAVVTLPAPIAKRLCPELSDEEKSKLANVQYQGIVCASVLLKNKLAGYYVTNITDDWVPFTAVIEMTALVDPKELGGHHLVYLPKYVAPDDPAFDCSDEEIKERFLSALERMVPDFKRADVVAFKVSRARHVLAVSTLNYSENLPPMTTSVPGLHVINSAHIVNGTLNVNETLQLAERALHHLTTWSDQRETDACLTTAR